MIDKIACALQTIWMYRFLLFYLPIMLALNSCALLQPSSNPLANNDISSDIECCCARPAPEPIINEVAAPATAPVVIHASDKDGDGVYDENDLCPNTEAGKKVDQRGCPEILLTLHGINFNSDSSKVRPDSERILAKAVTALQDSVGISVIIEGNTDNTGTPSYNQLLSERRAKAVLDFLVANGIEKERLVSVGKGANNPIADNQTKEGRYQNRRVEFRTVGTAFIKQEK